uniref:Cytoplasmic linker associated protein 1 n=1 Tax=Cyprinus carpio TaxID=7962 RepID=A0A8C1RNR7_CYPCA
MEPNMEYIVAQVTQKEVGRRFQVGPEIIDYIVDRQKSHDLEHDQSMLDRMVDSLATSWVNASNFKVALLGMDIVSALVTRLQERFRTQIGTVLPSLIDRLGDSKDQVRDQAQSLLLKIMDQAASPQYVWDRMPAGFRHKNSRTREAVCFCLISTLNVYGAHGLTLSKVVPHICHLLGDPSGQVRDGAMNCLVEIYRHVGERVRVDLGKKGLPQSRLNVIFSRFDEVQRSGNMILSSDKNIDDEESVDGGRSSSSSKGASSVQRTGSVRRPSSASSTKSSGKESSGAGAVDEEDFIRAFEDVPAVQIYSARELEDSMNKIREILSDDKHDWEQRVAALKKVRSLLLAGASDYDGFSQQLRQLEGPLKLSTKDLRSQVVREACITLGHLSSVLGNKFDHGAENIMPTLLNLVPNSAKVMATSGMAAIRLIIRVCLNTHTQTHTHTHTHIWAADVLFTEMIFVFIYNFTVLYFFLYLSAGRVRMRRQSSETVPGGGASVTDSRGRSRAKAVSQSQRSRSANPVGAGSRSSSPGKLLARSSGRIPRSAGSARAPADGRSKIPRSQGCSRETSPSRTRNVRASRIPRPSMSQGCSRDTSRESSRDTSPARGFSPLDRFGLIHQARISASVNAMRVLDTGTEVEAAVADALVRITSSILSCIYLIKNTAKIVKYLKKCRITVFYVKILQNEIFKINLNRVELKRLCEIFTRMFADPHIFLFNFNFISSIMFLCWLCVFQAAQMVLIALFELNTPEFTMLLGALPKTFQDGATKLLQSHLKNSSTVASPSSSVGRTPPRHPVTRSSPLTSPTKSLQPGLSPRYFVWGFGAQSLLLTSHIPTPAPPPPLSGPIGGQASLSLSVCVCVCVCSMLEYDTENINSEETFSSLRGVTEAIQSFSFRSQEDITEPVKRDGKREDTTGVDPRLSAGVMEGGRTALDNKTSLLNTPSPRSFSGPWAREYNPYNYSDSISTYEKGALAVFDDVGCDSHLEMIGDLLKELSNHSERVEERRAALLELLKVTRDDSLVVWEEHFKTMLLLLLETLGDRDHTIRALALRVLKEIMRSQPARFKNYAELTIMKTLEAHKDCHKEVVRDQEEMASTLAVSIHSEQCIKVLCPIIQTAGYPINLAAIKMQTKVIERIPQDSLIQLLPDIIPGLLQGYDNTESSVRKASVFCLVAIYSVIGEDLKPHLQQLTGSKLIDIYIYFCNVFSSIENYFMVLVTYCKK